MIHVKAMTKARITHGRGQFVVSKAAVLQFWPLVCESTGLENEHNKLLNLLEYVSNHLHIPD